jgi:hypothetical protein
MNHKKTKVAIFNTARTYDFMPKLSIEENTHLEVVEEFKLLGVVFQTDLRWQANTDYMCKKGYARLWMIRRLKALGADMTEMLDVFYKQIRSVLELAVAVWEPRLSQAHSKQLERVQKCAFYIILGEEYTDYDSAVASLASERLSDRRKKLCLTFARKAEKHEKFTNWFVQSAVEPGPVPNTRSDKTSIVTKYRPVPTRTDRFKDSPIPYMTEILNNFYSDE